MARIATVRSDEVRYTRAGFTEAGRECALRWDDRPAPRGRRGGDPRRLTAMVPDE